MKPERARPGQHVDDEEKTDHIQIDPDMLLKFATIPNVFIKSVTIPNFGLGPFFPLL